MGVQFVGINSVASWPLYLLFGIAYQKRPTESTEKNQMQLNTALEHGGTK